ncbi:hypothetical protein KSP40_PGU019952 [Platanthera guangdongensis]|uniref:Uncharacterized protein n=1 Tax=Platanthera guangdongensis TaxID=2320717 RepID=A0ABR2MR85_9ASPA
MLSLNPSELDAMGVDSRPCELCAWEAITVFFFCAEIHAAFAAAFYTDKHASLLAENHFTIATLLDPHYADISYVRDEKHWPPSLVCSLHKFITLF